MQTCVITIAHNRQGHLANQLRGLARQHEQVDQFVAVAMADPQLGAVVAQSRIAQLGDVRCRVVGVPVSDTAELPLAAARNRGAEAAIADGAELLIFLDADCIPGDRLVQRYREAAGDPAHRCALLGGPVTYLPPAGAGGYDLDDLSAATRPHAARPAPPDGVVVRGDDPRLFWSLSFGVTTATWRKVGGFCELYRGYGGEDTDFAEQAARSGVGLRWVGGADAYHQYHSVSSPPVEHVEAIVRNARLFHRRWGWWPMTGWLDRFAELGIAGFTAEGGWQLREPAGSKR